MLVSDLLRHLNQGVCPWSHSEPPTGLGNMLGSLANVMKFFTVSAEKVKNAFPGPKNAFQNAFPELGTPFDGSTLYPCLVFLN